DCNGTPPDCSSLGDCNGHGSCVGQDKCSCNSGWDGLDCSISTTACTGNECDVFGGIDPCTGFGLCRLLPSPPCMDCNGTPPRFNCSNLNDCNGTGDCVSQDQCSCRDGWTGDNCGTPTCSGVYDCSGNGTCSDPNTCSCNDGWRGSY